MAINFFCVCVKYAENVIVPVIWTFTEISLPNKTIFPVEHQTNDPAHSMSSFLLWTRYSLSHVNEKGIVKGCVKKICFCRNRQEFFFSRCIIELRSIHHYYPQKIYFSLNYFCFIILTNKKKLNKTSETFFFWKAMIHSV